MTISPMKILLTAAALMMLSGAAFAQREETPWVLEQNMGYDYHKDGKMFSSKMGTTIGSASCRERV